MVPIQPSALKTWWNSCKLEERTLRCPWPRLVSWTTKLRRQSPSQRLRREKSHRVTCGIFHKGIARHDRQQCRQKRNESVATSTRNGHKRLIDADVGLLIGSEESRALEPREIKSGNHGEPYSTRTDLGWVVNGPLRKRGNSRRTANLITADVELSKQFEKYRNMEFNDSYYDR